MFEDDDLVKELGLEGLTVEQRGNVLDEYRMQVGEALATDLSEEKLREFEEIINGNQSVVDAWLSSNVPDYTTHVAYQELQVGYDDDPEKVPADKAFASMAWIEVNSPRFRETSERIKQEIKANIDQYKD